jgi:hypothetical protein
MRSNIKYDVNIMYGFTLVGILIKLFLGNNNSIDGNSGHATTTIWGYGTVILSLIGILLISFSFATNNTDGTQSGLFDFIKKLINVSLPTIVMILLLAWLIVLNATYYKKINKGNISAEYYQYSNISSFLILSQLIVLFISLSQDEKPNKYTYISYFLGILNAIFIGINNIILTFFSTDG